MQIRLDKYLSDSTAYSRSEIKTYIKKGQAEVNSKVCRDPGLKVDPDRDEVCLKGQRLNWQRFHYYMLNKPPGLLSATEDASQNTVLELFPPGLRKGLFPVGRLDKDTVGLLLITDDGELAHSLLSPGRHVNKTYLVHTADPLSAEDADAFKDGTELKDGTLLKSAVLDINDNDPRVAKITIQEGKYHQIKRMIASRGNKVVYLKRLSMGSLTLDENLREGEYRPLREDELQSLRETHSLNELKPQ